MNASCAGTDTDLNYVRQEIVHPPAMFPEERAISPLQTHERGDINLGVAEALGCIKQEASSHPAPRLLGLSSELSVVVVPT